MAGSRDHTEVCGNRCQSHALFFKQQNKFSDTKKTGYYFVLWTKSSNQGVWEETVIHQNLDPGQEWSTSDYWMTNLWPLVGSATDRVSINDSTLSSVCYTVFVPPSTQPNPTLTIQVTVKHTNGNVLSLTACGQLVVHSHLLVIPPTYTFLSAM